MTPPSAPADPRRRPRRAATPLNQARLNELALAYVARFGTSRSRLEQYLARKLRERGWAGPDPADPAAIADRLAGLGYIDDAAFAAGRARAHLARGLGPARLRQRLRADGIADADRAEALALAEAQAIDAALHFARRRRIGPFAAEACADPRLQQRQLAAMVRAGHCPNLARKILFCAPGETFVRE